MKRESKLEENIKGLEDVKAIAEACDVPLDFVVRVLLWIEAQGRRSPAKLPTRWILVTGLVSAVLGAACAVPLTLALNQMYFGNKETMVSEPATASAPNPVALLTSHNTSSEEIEPVHTGATESPKAERREAVAVKQSQKPSVSSEPTKPLPQSPESTEIVSNRVDPPRDVDFVDTMIEAPEGSFVFRSDNATRRVNKELYEKSLEFTGEKNTGTVRLEGKYTRLTGLVGIDDRSFSFGGEPIKRKITFEVDGKVYGPYAVETLGIPQPIDIPLSEHSFLYVCADPGILILNPILTRK